MTHDDYNDILLAGALAAIVAAVLGAWMWLEVLW